MRTEAQPLRLNRTPLREVIYDRVLELISLGELTPGEEIHEEEIANWLSVSRPPVREALSKLEANGFLQERTGARAIVAGSNVRDAAIRERFIISLLSISAECAPLPVSGEDAEALDAAVETYEIAAAGGAESQLSALVEFDLLVMRLSKSVHLVRTYEERFMPFLLSPASYAALSTVTSRDAEYVRSLVNAFKGGDRAAALEVFENLRARAVARLVEVSVDDVPHGASAVGEE